MKRQTVWICFFVAALLLGLAALGPAQGKGEPRNPSLFEKRFQANQLVASFPVDPDVARQWVPPEFTLALVNGYAVGVINLLVSPEYSFYHTPNNPPLKEGENFAPDSVVHFWFALQGPYEKDDIPGAYLTNPTAYYYDVADLVTSKDAHSLYRRAGRPAILVDDITLTCVGVGAIAHEAVITFQNGRQITLSATSQPPPPITIGGNVWQWHVGGLGKMGNDLGATLDPVNGNPGYVSTTKVQYLGVLGGVSTITQIYADPGTYFEDVFGMNEVVGSGSVFGLNNVVLNASRGDLLWTDDPSPAIPVPPSLPEP